MAKLKDTTIYGDATVTGTITGDVTGDLTGNADTATTATTVSDNAITLAKMAHGTDGNLITYDAAGAPAYVATGTSGQLLTSNGAGAAPTFQDAAGGAGVTILGSGRGTTNAGGGHANGVDIGNFTITGALGHKKLIVEIYVDHADSSSVSTYCILDNAPGATLNTTGAIYKIGGSAAHVSCKWDFFLPGSQTTTPWVTYPKWVQDTYTMASFKDVYSNWDFSTTETIYVKFSAADSDAFDWYWKAYLINDA